MYRKAKLLALLFLSFYAAGVAQDDFDFNNYTREMDKIYSDLSLSYPDTLKVPGYRDYLRWKDFWLNRVHNDPSGKGDISIYGKKLMEAFRDPACLPEPSSKWSWEYSGPTDLITHNRGIISSLYVNSDNIDEVYAGSNSSGLFRTTNGGQTWECVTDNIHLPAMGINDIAVDPFNPDIKYLAINPLYRSGPAFIYKTVDNCKSWQEVFAPPAGKNVAIRVLLDPVNPSVVYTSIQDVLYRSLDAGTTWKCIFDSLTYDPSWYSDRKLIVDLEFKPGNPGTLLIATTGIRNHYYADASAEIWISNTVKEDTVTWSRITQGLPSYCDRYSLCAPPSDTGSILIAGSVGIAPYKAKFQIEKLQLDSLTLEEVYEHEWWQNYSSPFAGMGYWCNGFECSPDDPSTLFIGGYSIQELDLDSGNLKFYQCSLKEKEKHVDQRVFKVVSFQGKTYLFAGNDGGVTRLESETGILKSMNGNGLDNVQYYGIGHSETDPGFLIGGTQDNGVFGNGNQAWNMAPVGDAYEVIVDPLEPDNVYIAATGGEKFIARSTNAGRSFFPTPQPFASGGLNDRPFLMSPTDRNKLFVGYSELFMTDDRCLSWKQVSHFQDSSAVWNCGSAIGAIGLSADDPQVFYVAFTNPTWGNGNRLFRTSDQGRTWEDLTGYLGDIIYDLGITGITVSPLNADHVWASFNGYAEDGNGNTIHKVLFSDNGGINWTDISNALPDLPVNCLTGMTTGSGFRVLVGNDLGIFAWDANNSTWENIGTGLPAVIISDIEINTNYRQLIVGTFGRGIWRANIPPEWFNKPGNDIFCNRPSPSFRIYPNPAMDNFYLESHDGLNPSYQKVSIIDALGAETTLKCSGSDPGLYDISWLENGIYLVRITSEQQTTIIRLLKN